MIQRIKSKSKKEKKSISDFPPVVKEEHKYCLRCGRRLTTPQSKQLGYGMVCYRLIKRKEVGRLFDINYTVEENGK